MINIFPIIKKITQKYREICKISAKFPAYTVKFNGC